MWASFFMWSGCGDEKTEDTGLRRIKTSTSKFWIFRRKPHFFDVFHWQNPLTPIYKNDRRCFLYSTTPRSRFQLFLVKSYDFLDVKLYFFNFFKLKIRVKKIFFTKIQKFLFFYDAFYFYFHIQKTKNPSSGGPILRFEFSRYPLLKE